MIRYLIRNKQIGKWLKRTKSWRVNNTWVSSADDATLITSPSAASQIAQSFDRHLDYSQRFTASRSRTFPDRYSVEVVKVNVLLIPQGLQPFLDGVLNDNRN